jgi:hypothetical protein
MLRARKISHGTILIIVAGTLSNSGPAETFEVEKKNILTVSLAKPRYNAERVFENNVLFIYGDL